MENTQIQFEQPYAIMKENFLQKEKKIMKQKKFYTVFMIVVVCFTLFGMGYCFLTRNETDARLAFGLLIMLIGAALVQILNITKNNIDFPEKKIMKFYEQYQANRLLSIQITDHLLQYHYVFDHEVFKDTLYIDKICTRTDITEEVLSINSDHVECQFPWIKSIERFQPIY